jgi:hypothetical protein
LVENFKMKFCIVVPWFNPQQRDKFLAAWGIVGAIPDWLFLEQDPNKSGCGATKNRGIKRSMDAGAEVTIVLDDDVYCYPSDLDPCLSLEDLAERHIEALQPQELPVFEVTTNPPARGVPYFNRTIKVPVAASVGWWTNIPDRDAARQLIEGANSPMEYQRRVIYGRPTMLCGMNIAFRAHEWWPWCSFLPVSRMDDVFMSWLWCKEAARRNHCFNLNGPTVMHSRQSNVFSSLIDEAKWLEKNETLWSDIWMHPASDYDTLRRLVPVPFDGTP